VTIEKLGGESIKEVGVVVKVTLGGVTMGELLGGAPA